MSNNALYTDLSGYYDLMCADINYQAQSYCIHRLHQIFGNKGNNHLDLGCGTGPHIKHFIDFGFQSNGLDINQPMLDIASARCPSAKFLLQNMSQFNVSESQDLVTCFLYSIHYNASIAKLKSCILSVHNALNKGGVFCFNAVDKSKIDNNYFVKHAVNRDNNIFTFSSGWYYRGKGNEQSLKLSIEKTRTTKTEKWNDEHTMVAFSFNELRKILKPYFEIHIFEHDYEKIVPFNKSSGNAIFVCVKI